MTTIKKGGSLTLPNFVGLSAHKVQGYEAPAEYPGDHFNLHQFGPYVILNYQHERGDQVASPRQAKQALQRAITGKIRNRRVINDVAFAWKPEDDDHLHVCAYGVLALNAGYSVEQINDMVNEYDPDTNEIALRTAMNERYGISFEVGRAMERASDSWGFESALNVLEEAYP